jgi:ATP-binding cassette subfamily B protein RaxB
MLNFSLRHKTPVILQTEAAECGLSCLAMIASYHGHRIDLATLRTRYLISLRGSTLADLMKIAGQLKLTPRPLRAALGFQSFCGIDWCSRRPGYTARPGCGRT